MEEIELLLSSQLAMVSLGRLLLEILPLLQLFRIRKGYAINALQGLCIAFALPEARPMLDRKEREDRGRGRTEGANKQAGDLQEVLPL